MVGVAEISTSRRNINSLQLRQGYDNVSVVNRCAVPHILSGLGVLNKFIMASSISACDGLVFVEETKMFFCGVAFVITL